MKTTILAAAAIAVLALAVAPGQLDAMPSICPWRNLTGRPCIFCGMSHALSWAAHGDLARAATANPAWFLVLPLFLALVYGMATKNAKLGWAMIAVLLAGTVVRAM